MSNGVSNGKVGIIVPIYNPNRALLSKLLLSITQQTFSYWVFFLFDYSPQHTEWLADEIDDDRIKYVKNEKNLGIYWNYSRAIAQISEDYEYIFLSDQDDIWDSQKIVKYLEKFAENGIGLVVGNARVVDDSGAIIESNVFKEIGNFPSLTELLILGNVFPGTLMALRISQLPKGLHFPKVNDLPFTFLPHDYWIVITASFQGAIGFVEHILTDYVQHENNIIGYRSPKYWQDRFKTEMSEGGKGIFPFGFRTWRYSHRFKIFGVYFIISELLILYGDVNRMYKHRLTKNFVKKLSFPIGTWDKDYFTRTVFTFSFTPRFYIFFLLRWGSIRNFLLKNMITTKKRYFPKEWLKTRS